MLITYIVVATFIAMFAYIILFMVRDAEKTIANPMNQRQDSYAKYIRRGSVITSDGVTVAETVKDEEGREKRVYPFGSMFAHTVGYSSYSMSGVELSQSFVMLRSHAGIKKKIKCDLKGEKYPGDNVVLTLDYDLQKAAYDALGDCRGAVIVMDPRDGRILAEVSKPDFDPNSMSDVMDNIMTDEMEEAAPLLNRATQGLYAPGSTFKILTALEYMREHPDWQSYTYDCEGSDVFGDIGIHCAGDNVHGTVDISETLTESCNTSTANMGMHIDMNKLHQLAETFLYNQDLPYDGVYSASKFNVDGTSNRNDIPQTVIGQGTTLVTPLHNAMIMCAVANGGNLMIPYMIDHVESVEGVYVKETKKKTYGTLLEKRECDALLPMLENVAREGTASGQLGWKSYYVGGKTGTAEYDNEGNCNSWFIGFAGNSSPEVVISVVVEDYSTYGISGTYVASCVFDTWYEKFGQ